MTDELLVKFLLKETSLEEDRQVKDWIASDPANEKQFSDFSLIWNTSKNLESKSSVDENAAWERFKRKAADRKAAPEPAILPIKRDFIWLKVAASVILVSLIGLLLFRKSETRYVADNKVITETLPDGSVVTLNKNSSLTYSSSVLGRKRGVELSKGEVFFKVKPDKSKPFVISSGEVSVEVVGTSFNVKHKGSTTEVIVETGVVKVSEGAETVVLHAGEKVFVDSQQKLKVEKSKDQLHNYYRSNIFVADNTPLWRIVEILNEAYNANIIIGNPALRQLTLTTTFKNQSLNEILKVISETFNISITQKDNQIILQ
ncbi:FecR family protein [Desertivirga arenae]|uniref:FecR family protein n=1 Tax=Desertivirga arenae TaxID=2810309 RepID=UPI001A95FB74|nr:FecR domain-containing protein [Pedobacter sp. SYSU D00823]